MSASSTRGGEWRIAETATRCASCRMPFVEEQEFFSRLEIGDATLTRVDCCATCWQAQVVELQDPVYWKTRRRGGPNPRNVVDLNSLHGLLMNLLEDKRPEVEALRYVVALMLLRKKLLKAVRGAGGARGDLVFKDPRDLEQRIRLPAPDLSAESLENLKEQLGRILS